MPKLKWIHSTFTGVEPLLHLPSSIMITRTGGKGFAMAQYVCGWILAFERKLFEAVLK